MLSKMSMHNPSVKQISKTMRRRKLLSFANRIFAALVSFSSNKITVCVLAMLIPIAIRLAALPRKPIPKPYVTDEFSYLLGAETFASGRVTNPKHPMWEHFETLHELMQPTYMSKYPPGQALFLAVGWKLFGDPWFGVLISFGLFAACLCWMLQTWVPPVYAVLGTALTLSRISVFGYWMNSYWGGAVAAAAGCLLLGAIPRLARKRVRSADAVLVSIALLALGNSRPYEGLVLSIVAFVALLYWRHRMKRDLSEFLSPRFLIPLLLTCASGLALDGYFNYRVTGRVLQLPYMTYFEQYQIASPWLILPERKPPLYRHVNIENTWKEQDAEYQDKKANQRHNFDDLRKVLTFFSSPMYLFPIALAIVLSSSYRLWTATVILLCSWSALFIESTKAPHYVAASIGALALLNVYGLRWLRVIGGVGGPFLVITLVVLLCLQGRAPENGQPWETRSADAVSNRSMAMKEAMKQPGQQLILVRYSADHVDKSSECVYNSANIDGAQIVWAHDMGEAKNRELIDYYHGSRKVWLFQPDTKPGELIPYISVSK